MKHLINVHIRISRNSAGNFLHSLSIPVSNFPEFYEHNRDSPTTDCNPDH